MSEKITLQKIFDLAWQAFIIEGKPPAYGDAGDGVSSCLYCDKYGNRCAVGLSLPENFTFRGGFNSLVKFTVEAGMDLFDDEIVKMAADDYDDRLNTFQCRLHDKWVWGHGEDEGKWKGSLQDRMDEYLKVAEEYGLTIPPARPTQPTDH